MHQQPRSPIPPARQRRLPVPDCPARDAASDAVHPRAAGGARAGQVGGWRRLAPAWRGALLAMAVVAFLPSAVAAREPAPQPACPVHAPVDQVRGVRWYADREHNSIVDPERRREHLEAVRPVTEFMTDLGRAVDRWGRAPSLDCASDLMRRWAAADALLRQPTEFNGMVERAQVSRGLNIFALKLTAAGHPPDAATVAWLRRLTHAAIRDFARRARVDNLFAWSGVNASSLLMLTADDVAASHEQRAWEQAIAHIGPDGIVATEAGRGQRALTYHQYYLSAVLMMRRFREARGLAATPAEHAAIVRLAARVGAGHCDRDVFAAVAGGIAQEAPTPNAQRISTAMGAAALSPDYARCALEPQNFNMPNLGGRLDLTAELLARTRQTGRQR